MTVKTRTVEIFDPTGGIARWLGVEWYGPDSRLIVECKGGRREVRRFRRQVEEKARAGSGPRKGSR